MAFFGAIRIGAVPCPVNPLFKAADYRFFVEDAAAAVVVTDAANREKVVQALSAEDRDRQGAALQAARADGVTRPPGR